MNFIDPNHILLDDATTKELHNQYQSELHIYQDGDFVKTDFHQEGCNIEHMWVLVSDITENSIIGTLHNHPINISNIKFGDKVEVPFNKISQHIQM